VADDERPAVGTVAQEAARLLDALGGWAAGTRTEYAAGPASEPASEPASPEGDPGSTDTGSADPGPADSTRVPEDGGRCGSCGAANGMGQAVTCQLCPVCQGLGLLRSVRPETVDRLADLAGALAATLRDLAGQRRAADGAGSTRSSGHASRGRVQDITVEDDNDHPGSATS
jgi:hypothetical protein